MEYLVLMLVFGVLIGGGLFAARHSARQKERAEQAELENQLSVSKRAAEEDVTKFGEELQRLDSDVAGHALDEPMQQDYSRALDAYDDSKTSLDAVTRPDEIRHVTEILEDGRYAIACVKARLAGEPLPQKRPPCFFNPAHGPSSQNVEWAPAGGTAREVPACPADAERVLAGADPYIRTVQRGAQRVPYWEGGPAYAPWAQGYYSSWRGSDLLSGVLIGSLLFGGAGNIFGGIGAGMAGMGEGMGEMFEGVGEGFEGIGDGIGEMFGDLFD
ncbi:hypothetical protein [Desertihabitans aurantiacus]|uniref:hypothetical protein n=1 Tax=Desertihabitans aurantiacus TaxID=2282477 RepID=UPI000DF7383C|nr:hypothetical protein [Desertihabitans aurantiacus]